MAGGACAHLAAQPQLQLPKGHGAVRKHVHGLARHQRVEHPAIPKHAAVPVLHRREPREARLNDRRRDEHAEA